MSQLILTTAGAMFMVPLIAMTSTALLGDIPGWMLLYGGWSMAFSLIIGAIGIFIGMTER